MLKDEKHTSRKIDISHVSAKLISASELPPSRPDQNAEHCWKPGSLSPSSDDPRPPWGTARPGEPLTLTSLSTFFCFTVSCNIIDIY